MCLTFFKSTLYPDLEIPNAPVRTNFTKFPLIHCIPLHSIAVSWRHPMIRWSCDAVCAPNLPVQGLQGGLQVHSQCQERRRSSPSCVAAVVEILWTWNGHGMDMEWMNSSWIHYEFIMNWYCCGRSKTIRVHPPIMKCMKDCSWLFYMRVFRGVPIWWCLLIN